MYRIFVAIILLGCHSLLSADEIKLGEYLTVDVEDRDYTYQSFPDMGYDEEALTFWDGDNLLALVTYIGHDKLNMPFSSYLDLFIRDVKTEAEDAQFTELGGIKSDNNLDIRSYYATYDESGIPFYALYYFYPVAEGFQIVMCIVIHEEDINEINERLSAVLRTARID